MELCAVKIPLLLLFNGKRVVRKLMCVSLCVLGKVARINLECGLPLCKVPEMVVSTIPTISLCLTPAQFCLLMVHQCSGETYYFILVPYFRTTIYKWLFVFYLLAILTGIDKSF